MKEESKPKAIDLPFPTTGYEQKAKQSKQALSTPLLASIGVRSIQLGSTSLALPIYNASCDPGHVRPL